MDGFELEIPSSKQPYKKRRDRPRRFLKKRNQTRAKTEDPTSDVETPQDLSKAGAKDLPRSTSFDRTSHLSDKSCDATEGWSGLRLLLRGRYARLKKYFRDILLEELCIFRPEEIIEAALPRDKILMRLFIENCIKDYLWIEN